MIMMMTQWVSVCTTGRGLGRYAPRLALAMLVVMGVAARGVRGADVEIQVSSNDVLTGEQFTIEVIIKDAVDFEIPVLPDVPGLEIVRTPEQSKQTSVNVVNGRMTQSTTNTLRFAAVGRVAGRYEVPSFTVVADGTRFRTPPIPLVVSESGEGGDPLVVEIESGRNEVYLGEPVTLTLHVFIRPYRDDEVRMDPLPATTMWGFVDLESSEWGAFRDALLDKIGRVGFRRAPPSRRVLRDVGGGEQRGYDVFDFSAQVRPRQAGRLEIAPVEIHMRYPAGLQRSRGVFSFGDLEVTSWRVLSAPAEMPDVRVKDPPTAGRPPEYGGAVGRYRVKATAAPMQVAVGDPITLTFTIEDVTPGGGLLDLLPPPPLEKLPDLSRDFRMPSDPLAGIVDEDSRPHTKTFTQTMRAKRADVTRIPAIPYAFFDPSAEKYVTRWTDPIALQVTPAVTVAMSDVVGAAAAVDPAGTELTEVSRGLMANFADETVLLANQKLTLRWPHLLAVVVPPVFFAFIAVGQRRSRRLRDDRAYARRRGARRRADRRLAEARRAPVAERPERVAGALADYVADRCDVPSGAMTRAEVVARLESCGVADDLREDVERLLAECERLRYAGGGAPDGEAIAGGAARCLDRLERERLR